MEDDLYFDIYENLPENDVNIEEEISKLQGKVHQQEAHITTLESNVEKLTVNISEMKVVLDNLKKNISELYKTAKAEIERKDRLIRDLRSQVDQFTLEKKMGFPNKRPRDRVNSHELDVSAKRPRREYDVRRSRSRDKIKSRSRSKSREGYKDKDKVKEQSRYKSKKEHRSSRDRDRNGGGNKEGESKSKGKDNKNEGEKEKRRNKECPDVEFQLSKLFSVDQRIEKTVSKETVDGSEKIQRPKCLTDSEKINQKLFKNEPEVNITRKADLERPLIKTEKTKAEIQNKIETQVKIVKKECVKKDDSKTKPEKNSVQVDRKVEKEAKKIEEKDAQKKIGIKKEGERKNGVKKESERKNDVKEEELGNKHDVNENKDTKEDSKAQKKIICSTVEELERMKASKGENVETNAILDITDTTKEDGSKQESQAESNVRSLKTDAIESKNTSQNDEKNTDDGKIEEILESDAVLEEKKKTTAIVKTDVISEVRSAQKLEENKESTISNHQMELGFDKDVNMENADKTENCLAGSPQKKITEAKCKEQAADDPTNVGINKDENKVKKSPRPNKPKIEEVTKKLRAKWGEEGNVDNSCAIVTPSDCQIDKNLLDAVRNAAFGEEEFNTGSDLTLAHGTEKKIEGFKEKRKMADCNLPVVNQTEEEMEEGEIIDETNASAVADTFQKKVESFGTGGAVIDDKRSSLKIVDKAQKKCLTVREDRMKLETNAPKEDYESTDDHSRKPKKDVLDDQRKGANLADKCQKKSDDDLKVKGGAKTITKIDLKFEKLKVREKIIAEQRNHAEKSKDGCKDFLNVKENEMNLQAKAVTKKGCEVNTGVKSNLKEGVKIVDEQKNDAALGEKSQKRCNDDFKPKENEVSLDAKVITKIDFKANSDSKSKKSKEREIIDEQRNHTEKSKHLCNDDLNVKKDETNSEAKATKKDYKVNTGVNSKLKEGVKIIDKQRIDTALGVKSQKRCSDDLKLKENEVSLDAKVITKIDYKASSDSKSKKSKETEQIIDEQRNHAEKSKNVCKGNVNVKENETNVESNATRKDFNAGTDAKSKKSKEAKIPEDSPTESGRVLRSATRRSSNKDKSDNFDQENRQRLMSPANSVTLTDEGDIPVLHIPDTSRSYLLDSNSTSTPLKERCGVDMQLLKDDLSISLDASGIEDGRPCQNSVVWNTSAKSNTSDNSSNSSARKRRKVTLTWID